MTVVGEDRTGVDLVEAGLPGAGDAPVAGPGAQTCTDSAYHPTMQTTESGPSDATPEATADDPTEAAPDPSVPARSPRRVRLVASVVALAAVVLTGVVWNAVAEQRAQAQLEEARDALAAHLEDRARVVVTSEEVLARGADVHRASEGEVLDDSVRQHLDAALSALDETLSAVQEVATAPVDADLSAVREVIAMVAPAVALTVRAVDEAEVGITAVVDAQAEWVLVTTRDAYDGLVDELAALAAQADELLVRTEGAVLDEGSREHLAASAGRAAEALAVPLPTDADLGGAVEALRDLVAEVTAAITGVEDSGAAWQEEQGRLAAARSSQVPQPAPSSPAPAPARPGSGSSGSGGSPSPAVSVPQAPAAVPAPAPAQVPAADVPPAPGPTGDGSYWVETETGFGSDWCMDEFGNGWEC